MESVKRDKARYVFRILPNFQIRYRGSQLLRLRLVEKNRPYMFWTRLDPTQLRAATRRFIHGYTHRRQPTMMIPFCDETRRVRGLILPRFRRGLRLENVSKYVYVSTFAPLYR